MTSPASAVRRGNRHSASACLLALLLANLVGGCAVEPAETGTFEKALRVDGPARLEVATGSGDIEIVTGPAGQVQIRGEYRVRRLIFGATQRRAAELRERPPIAQTGNVINVGLDSERLRNITISYRITVPVETRLRASTGSGNLEASGIEGPARLTTGSGNLSAESIGGEVEVITGSGNIRLSNVSGPVVATAGSGDMELINVRGAIRARSGSGDVTLARPGDRAQISTGSGDVRITEAASDLRISTGSGDLAISGNPSAHSDWELRASSGEITMDVPDSASFRLYARTSSGEIEADIPLSIEEQSRKLLRARAGSGDARVEAQTSSGSVRIR